MGDDVRSAGALAHEAHGGGEDGLRVLPRLHGPGAVAAAVADALDVVNDGDVAVAGQDEVAVHAVHVEVGRDGLLGRGEALCDGDAAEDAASAGRVP